MNMKKTQSELSIKEAFNLLVEGNRRFAQDRVKVSQKNFKSQGFETRLNPSPFAVILSCIDSRVPVELVFDLSFGDIFSIRVAGNVVSNDVLGSMEFACKVAGAKVLLVLGHTKCGAVTAACNNVELGNVTSLLHKIKPAIDAVKKVKKEDYVIEDIALENVKLSIERIKKESPILTEMEQNKEIGIVGAIYDVSNGMVKFYN